jgi:hypothetical protein
MENTSDEVKVLNDKINVFWGEIAPCDHLVQIYSSDEEFIDILYSFVEEGLKNNEAVIIVATPQHRAAIDQKLRDNGKDPFYLGLKDHFISLDADETLSKFIVNDWVDDTLFNVAVSEIVVRAKRSHKTIRVFGEMVALLWARGLTGATVQLEYLWNNFRRKEEFCLFCAYPKSGFTENPVSSMSQICFTHSKVIYGSDDQSKQIFYSIVA